MISSVALVYIHDYAKIPSSILGGGIFFCSFCIFRWTMNPFVFCSSLLSVGCVKRAPIVTEGVSYAL